ncbi:MAG: DNA methyltransferase [Candidatus Dormibacteria bacterium]
MIHNLPLTRVATLVDHPLAAVVPEMRPAEWRAFLEDVRERGVLEPLRLAPDGVTVLDGRHRLRAARELGLEAVPSAPALCEPGDEASYMLRAALHRRHLSDDQRAILAARLAEAMGTERGRAQRQAAIAVRWTESGQASPEPDTERITPVHPVSPPELSRTLAARELGVSERRLRTAQALAQDAPDLAAQVEAGKLPLLVAKTQFQRREALAELAATVPAIIPEDGEIWQGDFREVGRDIPDASVDLVFTDPPYGTDYLEVWPDLGRLAYRVLKPGSFCLAYVGHLHLPLELAGLAAGGLEYWWQASIHFRGHQPAVRVRRVRTGWRSVLIFVKPPAPESPPWFSDWLQTDPLPERRYHEWGQSLGPARQLLRRFAPPGGLVLDPFAGAGTFPIAAVMEGRRALGIERDPGHAEVARRRVAGAERPEAASA